MKTIENWSKSSENWVFKLCFCSEKKPPETETYFLGCSTCNNCWSNKKNSSKLLLSYLCNLYWNRSKIDENQSKIDQNPTKLIKNRIFQLFLSRKKPRRKWNLTYWDIQHAIIVGQVEIDRKLMIINWKIIKINQKLIKIQRKLIENCIFQLFLG